MNRITKLISLIAAALIAAAVASGPIAAKPSEQYVPFVSDFPKASEKYVPFVSDFPRPAATPNSVPEAASGIDWSGAALEGGVAATLAALLAGAGLVLVRRRHSGPRLTGR